jgi:hypothetical protein
MAFLSGVVRATSAYYDVDMSGLPRNKTVTIKLSRRLVAKLERISRQRGVSRSEVLRDALDALEETKPGSPFEDIADLVGVLEGPGDLASNPRHMEGFGFDRRRHGSHRRAS